MATILWVIVGLEAFAIVIRLLSLTYREYPRIVTWSRGEDALCVFISALVVGFLIYLLTR